LHISEDIYQPDAGWSHHSFDSERNKKEDRIERGFLA